MNRLVSSCEFSYLKSMYYLYQIDEVMEHIEIIPKFVNIEQEQKQEQKMVIIELIKEAIQRTNILGLGDTHKKLKEALVLLKEL